GVDGSAAVAGGGPAVGGGGGAPARRCHRAGARGSQERAREVRRYREGVPGVPGRDEHWLVHFIELVLDVPGKLDVPGSSTFPRGCPGGSWEGRALARPRHRAGARRSRETRPGSSTL